MKTCLGCVHLVSDIYCKYGQKRYIQDDKKWEDPLIPITEMRGPEGRCGADRTLYRTTYWKRLRYNNV